jgi:transcriptional regulator with XRE-family HTH domain
MCRKEVANLTISERLRVARKEAGFTQREVADYIGVTESAYCGYETGKRQPDPTKISTIALFLNVTGDYLLGLVDNPRGYYGVTISDTDPQIDEIIKRCDGLTAQTLEKVKTYIDDLRYNPENIKKKPSEEG